MDELTRIDPEELRDEISKTDVFLGSMLNSDAEVTLLQELLEDARPPAVLIFTSQSELVTLSRLGGFDAHTFAPGNEAFDRLMRQFDQLQVPLPPSPHAVLAAAPRLSQRLDEQMLGPLWLYARAGLYWLNASPENFAQLFLHIANHHPAYEGRFAPRPPTVFPDVALWHPASAGRFFPSYDEYDTWYRAYRSAASSAARPKVGIVVFRQYVTGGTFGHYDAMISSWRPKDLTSCAASAAWTTARWWSSISSAPGSTCCLI